MENTEKKMLTEADVVDITIEMLRSIKIPAELCETVGVPVSRSISNLKVLKKCYEQKKAAEAEPETKEAEEAAETELEAADDGREDQAE